MTTQTHTVSTDALATLGTIIDETAGRDAIHLAVEPVIAAEKLFPGQHVGFVEGGVGSSKNNIGIVDPFISGFVAPGQRFWLVVYPRTITSLRHVWEHPSFPTSPLAVLPPVAPVKTDKEASTEWMTNWAVRNMSRDYYGETTTGYFSPERALSNAIEAGHNNHIGPHEDARESIDGEWWGHWETITGETGNRGEYFSCSC